MDIKLPNSHSKLKHKSEENKKIEWKVILTPGRKWKLLVWDSVIYFIGVMLPGWEK